MPEDSSVVVRPSSRLTFNIKVLAVAATILLGAVLYNSTTGWRPAASESTRRPAALPLQRRPSARLQQRFAESADPDLPSMVVVERPVAVTKPAASTTPPPPPPSKQAAPVDRARPSRRSGVPATEFARSVDREAAGLGGQAFAADGLSCHARRGYDIAGDAAYVWGLAFNVASAAECCAACAAQRRTCGAPTSRGKAFWRASRGGRTQGRCSGAGKCNAWIFCPGSDDNPAAKDRCFSYTIHNHTRGECWLKHEANQTSPIAAGPTLPKRMRAAPRKDWPWAVATNVWPWDVPEKIAWEAGLLAAPAAPVWRSTVLPDWHHKFCRGKHGPC